MWIKLLISFRKHIGFLIVCTTVISLFAFMSFENYRLQNTIKTLNQEKIIVEQTRQLEKQKAINEIKNLSDRFQKESSEREKYYAEKYQEVLSNYKSTQSSVNGLYNTTSEIRNNIRSTDVTRETIIEYVDKYEATFKECVGEYTKMAEDADKLVLINESLNSEIESIHTLMEEYRQKNPTISSD